jgi:hypothetical protein
MNNINQYETQLMAIARSTEPYPVDFDPAWQWIGYASKQKGLDSLKRNFDEGMDFNFNQAVEVRPDPLKAVLEDLATILAKYEADPSHKEEKNAFLKGCHAGYAYGLRRAIGDIQYEIGIRQDPPNINYPGERPQ